jgi:organic radical activating enzyme
MFGNNSITRQKLGDGTELRIVKGSPFLTLQGEGPYVGHKAVFCRIHGCNYRCTFCDTNFNDPDDPLVKTDQLIKEISEYNTELVVITGGEPFITNILPLCQALMEKGHIVQIETAGGLWIRDMERWAEIVCSPKTPTIHPMVKEHAVAFKYIISASNEHDGFLPITATQPKARKARLAAPRIGAEVYLSPCDEYDAEKNKRNRLLVADLAIKHGVIAGCQLHKVLGVVEPN